MKSGYIKITVELPVRIYPEKDHFLAECSILGVITQGETKTRAKKNIAEALELFLVSCYERGTLDQVLKECGFTPGDEAGKSVKDKNSQILKIPFCLQTRNTAFAQCHV